eukprot:m.206633 g.206633  ORF g.206633 m.206633 type:complete len:60 (-) comp17778_c0_seq1:3341-3520(-)
MKQKFSSMEIVDNKFLNLTKLRVIQKIEMTTKKEQSAISVHYDDNKRIYTSICEMLNGG